MLKEGVCLPLRTGAVVNGDEVAQFLVVAEPDRSARWWSLLVDLVVWIDRKCPSISQSEGLRLRSPEFLLAMEQRLVSTQLHSGAIVRARPRHLAAVLVRETIR